MQVGVSFTPGNAGSQSSGLPNAYLRYVFYDETGTRAIQSGKIFVTSVAHTAWERLHFDYEIPANGILQIYTANETDRQNVWFDDLKVDFTPQLIVQENHYYPFGLELEGLSKHGKPEHRWKFQGQEEQKEFGLNWSSFKWRNADVALGRFFSVDPLSESFYYNSTYAFSENQMVAHFELEGLEKVQSKAGKKATKPNKNQSNVGVAVRMGVSTRVLPLPVGTVSDTYNSGQVPNNNIFPWGARLDKGKKAASLTNNPLYSIISEKKVKRTEYVTRPTKAELTEAEREEFDALEMIGVQNMTSVQLSRFRQLENEVRPAGGGAGAGIETVIIYKAPQSGEGKGFLKDGFTQDFRRRAYFAGPGDRWIAEEYNRYYGEGILEIKIPKSVYDEHFKKYEQTYLGERRGIEVVIPKDDYSLLNTFSRELKDF
ncbi:hypothetical protein [uncultured Microscilla sp.]|uniref:RHS repeat domain-containing protein n=1 Tax=uncultured Microscilla sp. TaxID=432653 RepID=UPI00260C3AC0|nr:hypothetical protein [uncultured Microscilla sp.]